MLQQTLGKHGGDIMAIRHRLGLVASVSFTSWLNFGCAADMPRQSHLEQNVTIPQGTVNSAAVVGLLERLQTVVNSDTKTGSFAIQEVLSFLPLNDEERAAIVAAHPEPVPVSCQGDYCLAVSRGSEVYVRLSQMENSQAWFGRQVDIKLRWRGPTQLEICNLKGFQVKRGIWLNVDGTFIDAQGVDGSSFVDVSIGGSYPNC